MRRIRFAYFGYSVEFSTARVCAASLRAEANALVLAEHGVSPALGYVEPGVPFPAHVPAQVWEGDAGWRPYL